MKFHPSIYTYSCEENIWYSCSTIETAAFIWSQWENSYCLQNLTLTEVLNGMITKALNQIHHGIITKTTCVLNSLPNFQPLCEFPKYYIYSVYFKFQYHKWLKFGKLILVCQTFLFNSNDLLMKFTKLSSVDFFTTLPNFVIYIIQCKVALYSNKTFQLYMVPKITKL